jgi:hypothetical protein
VRCAPWCIHCCSTARDLRVGVGLGVVHARSRHATTESGNGRYASNGIGQRMLKAANRATSILRSRYQDSDFSSAGVAPESRPLTAAPMHRRRHVSSGKAGRGGWCRSIETWHPRLSGCLGFLPDTCIDERDFGLDSLVPRFSDVVDWGQPRVTTSASPQCVSGPMKSRRHIL